MAVVMENITEWISSFSNDEIIAMYSEITQRPKREKTSIADVLQKSLEEEWISRNGNRRWHINRCTPGSKFNNTPYNGIYVPWCLGGFGYILSRKAINVVGNYNENYDDEIYEDLLIGKILLKSDIKPVILNGFHF